jgi:RNA polymerase sigma-70 factor (ECF subfamily)
VATIPAAIARPDFCAKKDFRDASSGQKQAVLGGVSMTGMAASNGQWIHAAVQRYEAPLMVYAARLVRDPDAARDIVQDVFTKLCTQDPTQVGPVLPQWLYTVCRNRALDVRRKEKRMMRLADSDVDVAGTSTSRPVDLAELHDTSQVVVRLVEQLSDDQQEVIRLRFQHAMSYQQIAEITGHSVSNVGVLIHTAIKKLREKMAVGKKG